MSIVAVTGTKVVPGEVVYAEPLGDSAAPAAAAVVAGQGTFTRVVEAAGGAAGAERHVVALRLGVAQWDGAVISVYPRAAAGAAPSAAAPAAASSSPSTTMFGPRPRDRVHLRVNRVSRLSAAGDIVAINNVWRSGSATLGRQDGFRGVIRVEDIRPFKPSKDQLQPPAPSMAFQVGDVVVAEVISQSDVRQYQLSTLLPHCGVVESVVASDGGAAQLVHIPGRRDAMTCPTDNSVHYRWTPLLEL